MVDDATTGLLLGALHRAQLAALGPRLAELGLHPGAELLLMEAGRSEGANQTELAGRLGVSPPSVTKVVRGLARQGLIERLADPTDARVVRVHLTAKGRRLGRPIREAWREAERVTLARLEPRERAQLRRLLARALAKAPVRPAP